MSSTDSSVNEKTAASKPFSYYAKKAGKILLHQWLIIGMGLACLFAYLFPDVAKQDGIIQAQYSILYGAVAVIFLISGLGIPKEKLIQHLLNYRLHLVCQFASYVFIPVFFMAGIYLIDATDPKEKLDRAVLAGYVILGCLPTTTSSNIIMTKTAGGDDAAALVQVLISNVLGPFIAPGWAMTLMPSTSRFAKYASSGGSMGEVYASTFKNLGLAVFLPLVVGQAIRWIFPNAIPHYMQKFYINKLSSVCLLLIIWSSFSTCFSTGALEALSKQTIAFVCVINVVLYLFLTGVCFTFARPPNFMLARPVQHQNKAAQYAQKTHKAVLQKMPVGETIAICFCGPAKTTGLGIPMLYAMYQHNNMFDNARMSVPLILYTTQQIFAAHFMVHLFHRWSEKATAREQGAAEPNDEEAQRPQTESDSSTIIGSTHDLTKKEGKNGDDDESVARPDTAATAVDGRYEAPSQGNPAGMLQTPYANQGATYSSSTVQSGHTLRP
ncbi:hypothetical protein KEM55_003746 [Ascosphaera atra]|nr:hypothetical protein KEM55_003746 [Ascosphaera atra]